MGLAYSPQELIIVIDGQQRKFTDYTRELARVHFPELRQQPIFVPPIPFHQTWLCTHRAALKRLQEKSSAGLFQDVTVVDHNESTYRSALAEYVVAEGFRHYANSRGRPCAVILGHKFENYLSKVRQQLVNVQVPPKGRGEHDLLFIDPCLGLLVVSVKSVGGNFVERGISPETQENDLKTALEKALSQLETEVKVVSHVLGDLSPPVTPVLALPNIGRNFLTSVLDKESHLRDAWNNLCKGNNFHSFLCAEEFSPLPDRHTVLATWFQHRFAEVNEEFSAFSLDNYEDIVGRYCGLCSVVDVHHRQCEGRIEVRVPPEAVAEVSRRFRSLLLLPEQVAVLGSSYQRVYLYGMLGSGKTVMLMLKARQWLHLGYDVIVVNVSYDVDGSPMGHALLRDIEKSSDRRRSDGAVSMINVRLTEFKAEDFLRAIRHTLAAHRRPAETLDETTNREGPSGAFVGGRRRTDERAQPAITKDPVPFAAESSQSVEGSSSSVAEVPGPGGVDRNLVAPDSETANKDGLVVAQDSATSGGRGARESNPLAFILDEVYPSFHPVFRIITDHFPQAQVWTAGLERQNAPDNFDKYHKLEKVLRCPPTVQRVLKRTDYDPDRLQHYTVCGAKEGLPSEGPPTHFIFHRDHRQRQGTESQPLPSLEMPSQYSFMASYSPLFCAQCANEFCDFLQKSLGLQPSAVLSKSSSSSSSSSSLSSSSLNWSLKSSSSNSISTSAFSSSQSSLVLPSPQALSSLKSSLDLSLAAASISSSSSSSSMSYLSLAASEPARATTPASPAMSSVYKETGQSGDIRAVTEDSSLASDSETVRRVKKLKLGPSTERSNQKRSPNKQKPKQSPKKPKQEPRQLLSCKDVVVLVKDPDSQAVYQQVGEIFKLDHGLFSQFVTLLERSPFTGAMRSRGFPVRTIQEAYSAELAAHEKDEITVTWVTPVSGLEWSVVLFIPGDPPTVTHTAMAGGDEEAEGMYQPQPARVAMEDGDFLCGQEDQRMEEGLRAVEQLMSDKDRQYLFWGGSRSTAQLIVIVP